SEDIDNSSMNIYKSNLKAIAEFIEADSILDSLREELVEHIKNNLKFVVVETKATLTETLNIFDTINTSGMDLNGADVFKIKIYEYMKKSKQAGKEVFNEIDGLYKKVIEENKKYGTSVTMGQILELYKDYLISLNNLPISVMKMGTDSFFEKLFDGLIRNRFDSKVLSEDNLRNIQLSLSDVERLIEARFLWEEMRKTIPIEAKFEEQLIYWSRYGRYFKAVYYILFREKNQDSVTVSLMIKKLCKLFTVYSVVYDKQVNDMMKFMKDIYARVLKGESLEIIFSQIEATTKTHPNNWDISESFTKRINEPLAAKTTAKNLLCRIESMLHEEFDGHSPEAIIKNYFKEHIDIEHIQAYNDCNNAEEIREIWKDEINSIGNLMILESSINRSIGNDHFSDKKQKYESSRYQIAKNISALNQWTKEDAEKRRAEAVKRISNYIYSDL
ncbi:MAG: HNH endonuclease family protein, partial [Fusobacteriaceae bacterium]